MEIELTAYGSAVLLAEMNFKDPEYVPKWKKFNLEKIESDILGGKVNCLTPRKNSNYPYKTHEEERLARYKHEQKRRKFIIEYLREKYPDKDYADTFEKEDKWGGELRYHNEDTKKCKYLNEDGRHCDKKRKNTSCYTCCFNCFIPKDCGKGECEFLNKVK